ncbi:MAG: M20/M25/M40 family metallo-hydrolase [Candidatus Hydrogenedentales bacterium]
MNATSQKCSTLVLLLLSMFACSRLAPAQPPSFDERAAAIERKLEEIQRDIKALREAAKSDEAPQPSRAGASDAELAKIRDEGLNRSQVMPTLSYITDVIGPRLTGSPNLKRANEWTRDRFASWGLSNAHLEQWGPFGRGWSLKSFSIQVVEPQTIPLIASPKAWTPGFDKPIVAEVVYLDAKTEADLEKYQGKLKGAVVLAGAPRPVKIAFEPQGRRMTDEDLRIFAESKGGRVRPARAPTEPVASAAPAGSPARPANAVADATREAAPGEPSPAAQPAVARDAADGEPERRARPGAGRAESAFARRMLAFLVKEEAALLVTPSPLGDAGTIFVASVSVPSVEGRSGGGMRPWSTTAPATPPQVALNVEDYNRLVRMIEHGEKLKMAVDLAVQFHEDDPNAYNTVAEIQGSDLKDEIVMLGGHLDSWHAGTGATDNGAGVAVAMEAVRILKAAGLQPRRTVRVALWTGEEQGLLGSKAYVAEHFGSYSTEANANEPARQDRREEGAGQRRGRGSSRTLVRKPDYDKFAAYFNLDNGAGRIRGIFAQENAGAWAVFRDWLGPFRDLGAETVTLATTGGTDHLSFDAIGLPGFQFIQDPIEYMSRTHHSNADVYDRIVAEDLKQASVIMASFVYHAAMADEKLPRKETDSRTASAN